MFQAKDYFLAREDRIIGVGVLQLANVVEQGSCAMWIQLGTRLHIDDDGLILLRILSQRQTDNVGFVDSKSYWALGRERICPSEDRMPLRDRIDHGEFGQ